MYQTPAAALGKPPGPAGEPQHAKTPHEKIGWGWASGGAGQRGLSRGKATWMPSIGQPGCWGELILVSRRPGRPVESWSAENPGSDPEFSTSEVVHHDLPTVPAQDEDARVFPYVKNEHVGQGSLTRGLVAPVAPWI